MEEWKDIADFEEYEVSSLGQVRSKEREITYSDGRVRLYKSHVLKTGGSDYKTVILSVRGKYFTRNVHRLVAEAFLENPDNLPLVEHKDDNKHNNVIENLMWSTSSSNNGNAYKRGLKKPGKEVACFVNDRIYENIHRLAEAEEITPGCAWYRCTVGLSIEGNQYGLL